MEIRQLRYFVAVAEEVSFTKAASRLHVSQPALSRGVKALEGELGVELLVRDTGSVTVSPAGQALLPMARSVLSELGEIPLEMRRFARCREAHVDVGYLAPTLGNFLAGALSSFSQAHESIRVQLHELSPSNQVEALREGRLDLALVGHACPDLAKEFDLFEISRMPLCIAAAATDPLAKRKRIPLGELSGRPFVALAESQFPGRREIVKQACAEAGFKPRFTRTVSGMTDALALVATGTAVALMPEEVRLTAPPQVSFVRCEKPRPTIEFRALVAKGERRKGVRAFLQECRRIARLG